MRCLLIIYLTRVKLNLGKNMQFIFSHRMTTMNPIAITKFFHITSDIVFILLLVGSYLGEGLLRSITNYFATMETNSHSIFQLYYFV